MKTRYLNAGLKDKIKENIEDYVRDKMDKSIPGKELKALTRQIVERLRLRVSKRCPDSDLQVLKKYELTSDHSVVSITLSDKDEILRPWQSSNFCYKIKIDPVIETHKLSQKNRFLIDVIRADEKLSSLCISTYKIKDHIKCEINETVRAYMSRIAKFRTVDPLLKAYPNLKKFIPKQKSPGSSKEDKVIAAFEAA